MNENRSPVVTLPPEQHPIRPDQIEERVWGVVRRLTRAGFKACLVGGAVRDLLLGKTPKDYDVVTDARPNQVKRLFSNCFLVGRRFRLAHIRFGQDFIEVATFRKEADVALPLQEGETHARHLRNYGTPREDAFRRDFTVNALFYDTNNKQVIDYVGGLADLKEKRVRTVIDPGASLTEDPVRMLRAVRLAGRHGFTLDPILRETICRRGGEVLSAPKPRLLDEFTVLLGYGASLSSLRLLNELGLLNFLFPPFAQVLADPQHAPLFGEALQAIDARAPRPEEGVVWTYLLFPLLLQRLKLSLDEFYWNTRPMQVVTEIDRYFPTLVNYLPVPKAVRARVSDNFIAQARLVGPRRFGNPAKLQKRKSFAEILDLFEFSCRLMKRGVEARQDWTRRARG